MKSVSKLFALLALIVLSACAAPVTYIVTPPVAPEKPIHAAVLIEASLKSHTPLVDSVNLKNGLQYAVLFGGVPTVSALCANDGSAGQPSGGTTPLSSIFPGSYVATSPCAVYGVTAKVGADTSTAIVDPTTFSWSAPFSYDAGNHEIRCDDNGTTPPLIQDMNFGLHNGLGVNDVSCGSSGHGGVRITNSIFAVGSNCKGPINQSTTAVGFSITKSTFDGGGLATVANCGGVASQMMNFDGGGAIVVQYVECHDMTQHCWILEQSSNGSFDLRFNLVRNGGWGQGPHADDLMIFNTATTQNGNQLSFNTAYNPQPTVNMVETPTATFTSGSNTFTTTQLPSITGANDNSLVPGSPVTSTKLPAGSKIASATTTGGPVPTAVSTSITVTTPGNVGASSSGSATFAVQNAYPSNGIPMFFLMEGGGSVTNTTVEYNTMIAVGGSIQTAGTMVYCGAKPDGSTMTGVTFGPQYIDHSGAQVVFTNDASPSRCPNGVSGNVISNSVDMSNGGSLVPGW